MRGTILACGLLTLAFVWLGPLPALAAHRFSAHMTVHMAVVAVAAPLLGFAAAGGRFDLARVAPSAFSPIPASLVELVVVWAWHTPALHQFARASSTGMFVEQAMFLSSGLLVWMASVSGPRQDGGRTARGIVALLLTSMHMTLLGALIALAPRPLFAHASPAAPAARLDVLLDEQHLGGAIMVLVGGASYLAGGLWLSASLLASHPGTSTGARGLRIGSVRR